MKYYKQIFDHLYQQKPSSRIASNVMARIDHAKNIGVKAKAFVYGVVSVGSIVALLPIVSHLDIEAGRSGLYDYLSLVASDTSYAITNWKTMILSISESLPIANITISLCVLLIFVYTLKKSARLVSISSSLTQFSH